MSYSKLFSELSNPQEALAPELAALTPEQRAAVLLPFSDSAVIRAGAGSGKTRLLVERAVQLLKTGVNPSRIALISYTRKSAEQLSERIATRLGNKKRVPVCSTLHALALKLCAKSGPVYLFKDEGLDEVVLEVRSTLGPSAVEMSDKDIATLVGRHRELRQFTSTFGLAALHWMEVLMSKGVEDFTSLIERAHPAEDERFDYILVDEAQDLSPVQLEFVQRLRAKNGAVWFVGDDDQSIFLFRGAGESTMQRLVSTVDHQKLLTLNWRCDVAIVNAANALMAKAEGREHITWASASKEQGEVSHRRYLCRDDEEAAAMEFVRAAPGRMILARTQRQLESLRTYDVACCTVHESKGLEWDGVWVLGCVDGLFPHVLSSDSEERRLFYVAMTRARHELVLGSHERKSADAKKLLSPSPYLRDVGLSRAK